MWAKEINAEDFDQALQQFLNLGFATHANVARETGAHAVANRNHSLLLQKYTSSINQDPISEPTIQGLNDGQGLDR